MGIETAIAVAAVVGAGATVYSATQRPKLPGAPKLPDSAKARGVVAPPSADLLKQRQRRAGAAGNQTLLTGPLGLVGEPTTAPKSLLGQ